MNAPDPPAVYWCARTGELATDYTAGMVYLDEHHQPPDDAVRLVPEHPGVAARSSDIVGISTARTARARQDKTGRLTLAEHIAQRIDWTPTCLPGTERATIVRQILDLDDDAADFDRAEGVAALLRRCEEIERAGGPEGGGHLMHIAEVRALLGGADNNNEGERRG